MRKRGWGGRIYELENVNGISSLLQPLSAKNPGVADFIHHKKERNKDNEG